MSILAKPIELSLGQTANIIQQMYRHQYPSKHWSVVYYNDTITHPNYVPPGI